MDYVSTLFIFSFVSSCAATLIYFIKIVIDRKQNRQEMKEVQEEVKNLIDDKFKSRDVIDLMLKNVRELREYYIISKRQATNAFSASLMVCFLGFSIYIAGLAVFVIYGKNPLVMTTVSGTIVEVISGLFFWLYRHTLTQLNIYHKRLGMTEKYLTAIRLVDKMEDDKHDDMYKYIIKCILMDNHEQRIEESKKGGQA